MKICKKCMKKYPENEKYFHRQKGGKNNLRSLCKSCSNKRQRIYYKSKEKYKINNRKNVEYRRNKKAKLKNNFTKGDWIKTLEYFNHSCAYCGMSNKESLKKFKENLSKDHIIPLKERGDYVMGNIIPSCKSCNSSKGARNLSNWYKNQYYFDQKRLEKIYLFTNKYRK